MKQKNLPQNDEAFMLLALVEARRGIGQTSPNPSVGAVLVKDGRVIATGWHRGAGRPHAEIEALRSTSADAAREATLYVTLEPCSTHGRTPPCVDAIIHAGIRRVICGAIDPNPKHAGRGLEVLRTAGLEVTSGVLAGECERLNRPFNKWITTGLPWVIAKAGMSLDGRLVRPPQEGQWLTNAESRADAHQLRATVDAILIGAGTLRTDNPRLTVRGVPNARQPWRVILTRSGQLPPESTVFTDEFRERTVVYKELSLSEVLRHLGGKEVTSVLIEGGASILTQAIEQNLVDAIRVYIAPILTGGSHPLLGGRGAGALREAIRIDRPAYRRIGSDLCLEGELLPPPV